MKLSNVAAGLVVVSMFAGCSIFESKPVDYKAGAVQTPALEVPPDLTAPEPDQRYVIPGSNGEASYSEYSRMKTEQPCVSAASAPAAAVPVPAQPATPAARLQESNGIKTIVLNEPFDRSWLKVGLALDHAQIVVTDKDRSKGIFFVAATADKDSKDKKQKQPDYQVVVRENANGSEVTVVDQNGKSDAVSAKLVETIYQNLNQSDRGNGHRQPGDAVRSSR
jgi:outer membrane protein assembly factor BamC